MFDYCKNTVFIKRIANAETTSILVELCKKTWQETRTSGKDDTAAAKMQIMRDCGITVVDSPAAIGETMAKVLKGTAVVA